MILGIYLIGVIISFIYTIDDGKADSYSNKDIYGLYIFESISEIKDK